MECEQKGSCEQVFPGDVGLPTSVKIDLKKNFVLGTIGGKTRTTEVKSFERRDGKMILQGYEDLSWSLIIGEKTGKMTLSVSGEEDGFVLFGNCMAP